MFKSLCELLKMSGLRLVIFFMTTVLTVCLIVPSGAETGSNVKLGLLEYAEKQSPPNDALPMNEGRSKIATSVPALNPKIDWTCYHPKDYVGEVWIQVIPQNPNINVIHKYTLNWGPLKYQNTLDFGGSQSISLVHRKGPDDRPVALCIKIFPPAYVRIGQGQPPDEKIIDINDGWTKRFSP